MVEIEDYSDTKKQSGDVVDDPKLEDEDVLKFMDSLNSYLLLLHSLSSTLRQGWFDFSSARYSMGASRVNCVLLDLKEHSAPTHLQVTEDPHFTLRKWVSHDSRNPKNLKADNSEHQEDDGLSHSTETEEDDSLSGSSISVDDLVQRERSKSLAVFGTLVSPKLRAAQLSFETALEKVVEIANVRASMISSFEQLQGRIDRTEN